MGHGLLKCMATALTKPRSPLIAIIGCTGTGKSQLAVDLARKYNGEIINGDAMQLYHGLDIITNKIPVAERDGIPHHLLGCISIHNQPWSARDFTSRALKTIEDIQSRQKLPILVGGTHYYLQSLLFRDSLAESITTKADGNDESEESPNAGEQDRTQWPILDAPTADILAKLQEVDPIMSRRWHPNDRRRIQRSLEIFLHTGRPASDIYMAQRSQRPHGPIPDSSVAQDSTQSGLCFPTLLLWAYTPRETLHARLDKRVHTMMDNGLLTEVRTMREFRNSSAVEIDESRGIWQSIGYKQFLPYVDALDDGSSVKQQQSKRDEAVAQTQAATRQYSRRQERWIRIKLLNALRDVNAQDSLLVIDTAKPSDWENTVLNPAFKCCDAFLAGAQLPDASEICSNAAEVLQPLREYDVSHRADTWGTWTCEVCNVTVAMEEQWEKHIKGNRHRKLMRKAKRRSEDRRALGDGVDVPSLVQTSDS